MVILRLVYVGAPYSPSERTLLRHRMAPSMHRAAQRG
jgi:hypothetical protein